MFIERKQLIPKQTIDFHKVKLGYKALGKGKPVILIHGSMISDPWGGFEYDLAKSYQVILPHLPGFGSSDAIVGKLHNTELFAEALCTFIQKLKLTNAPIIAFSLGAVVAVKAATSGCLQGKLILVGFPVQVTTQKLKVVSLIPVWIRRLIGSTTWGRDKLLIPVLRDIIGSKDKKRDDQLLLELQETDTRSLVDLDIDKEINQQIPGLLNHLTNLVIFVYGQTDKLIDTAKNIIKNPVIMPGAGHNVFRSQPQKLLNLLAKIIA